MENNDSRVEDLIKEYYRLLTDAIQKRFEILITISTLTVALLIIASFGDSFIKISSSLKSLIMILLFIMALSLSFYFFMLNSKGRQSFEAIEKKTGIKLKDYLKKERESEKEMEMKMKKIKRFEKNFERVFERIITFSPDVILLAFIYLIWRIVYLIGKSL